MNWEMTGDGEDGGQRVPATPEVQCSARGQELIILY